MLAKGKHSKTSSVVNVIIFLESDSCLQRVSTLKKSSVVNVAVLLVARTTWCGRRRRSWMRRTTSGPCSSSWSSVAITAVMWTLSRQFASLFLSLSLSPVTFHSVCILHVFVHYLCFVQFTCSLPALLAEFTCSLPALFAEFTCSLPALHAEFTCSLPALLAEFSCSLPVLCAEFTCPLPVLCAEFTCPLPVLCAEFTCSLPVLCAEFTCLLPALLAEFTCS